MSFSFSLSTTSEASGRRSLHSENSEPVDYCTNLECSVLFRFGDVKKGEF